MLSMLKQDLDKLVEKFEIKEFITHDPIQFPHRYEKIEDIEISAFVSSLFAYGNREVFVKKLEQLFDKMDNAPLDYVLKSNFENLETFNYRFAKDVDIVEVLKILGMLYKTDGGLQALFSYGMKTGKDMYSMFEVVCDYFYSRVENKVGQGFYHLIANPKNNGTMKRMNMFMRWMIRDGNVDLGVWDFVSKSQLLIPLDVHVARISRELGLLERKSNDKKAVYELTNNLKKLDCDDPVKYDFAMFGKGIDDRNKF